MFLRLKKRSSGKTQILIVESVREGGRIKQRSVRSLGTASTDEEIEQIVKLAEEIILELQNARKPMLPGFNKLEIHFHSQKKKTVDDGVLLKNLLHESTVNDGIVDVLGKIYKELGLQNIFGSTSKGKDWSAILEANVLARLAKPLSKRATSNFLHSEMALRIPLDRIYRMMDKLSEREDAIKMKIFRKTSSIFQEKVDVLFFDVTTLYFESIRDDELKKFGFSKDCKFKEVQVVLALVTTAYGAPITYHLYPGNTYEGHTLIQAVKELKEKFSIEKVMIMADRAMFTNENLDFMDKEGIKYIVAAKLKALSKDTTQSLQTDLDYKPTVVIDELHWVKEYEHKKRRLIVSYSSRRAKKDAADRQRLVDRLLKKARDGKINLKDIIPNRGTKKYLKINHGSAEINEEKIVEAQKWDGLHGVITNNSEASTGELLENYRGLWQIEEAFRVNKHSLKMRPIYHWTEKRIRAHILICYISFAVAKFAVIKLKSKNNAISFDELREILLSIESVVVKDRTTEKLFIIPSKTNAKQKKIYQIFGATRTQDPFAI